MEDNKKRQLWTKKRCAIEALKYQSRRRFQKGCQSAYQKAYKENWLDEICAHMTAPYKPNGYWTKEKCAIEAKKYNNRNAFHEANPVAYTKAYQQGWLDEICAHMEIKKRASSYWTKERCHEEALKYKTRIEFSRGCCSAYNKAAVCEWLDEICNHMVTLRKRVDDWTLEECIAEANKYDNKTDFKRSCPGAYNKAYREKWLDNICSHMKKKFIWTKEECAKVALLFDKRTIFYRKRTSAYNVAKKNGWLDEICSHMAKGKRIIKKNQTYMESIKLSDLEVWLVDFIVETIHSLRTEDNEEFNKWAKSFRRDDAEFVVGMDFGVDWGYEEQEIIPREEAVEYAKALLQEIIDDWYM